MKTADEIAREVAGVTSGAQELLERFIELAPKEWTRLRGTDGGPDWWHTDGEEDETQGFYLILDNDRCSAEAIVFLLDWLEAKGLCVNLDSTYKRPHCNPAGKYWVLVEGRLGAEEGGATRIEALVRAVVNLLAAEAAEKEVVG